MHERRFAGAVMADEAQAGAGIDHEIDAGEGADGAKVFSDRR
jgi:hypothetical protein